MNEATIYTNRDCGCRVLIDRDCAQLEPCGVHQLRDCIEERQKIVQRAIRETKRGTPET